MKRKIKNWLAVFLALICCICIGTGTVTAQETLLEENFSSSTYPPDGWTRYTGALDGSLSPSTYGWTRKTTTPISGGYSVAFNMYDTRNFWLVTPSITLPANSTLELDVAATDFNSTDPATDMGSNEIFYIVVSTDGGETWTTENVVAQYDYETSPSLSDFTTPTHLTVSLANYTGNVKIGFYGYKPSSGGDWDIHIGNILVSAPVSCYKPTVLTVEDITSSAAAVSWTMNESNPNASINLQYTLATDANWENPIATITNATNPYSLTELTANTQYKVRVQADCGDSEVSAWKEGTFKTACGIITDFPWTEGFESTWGTTSVLGSSAPNCWAVYNGGVAGGYTSYAWSRATGSNSYAGDGHAQIYTDYAESNHNDWLVTPLLALDGNKKVSFYARNYSATSTELDEISVWISDEDISLEVPTDDAAPLAGFTQLFQTTIPQGGYQRYEVLLNGYAGNRYIAFVRRDAPSDGYYLRLDDVTVDDIPSCVEPTTVTVNNITSSTATVNWVNNEANADASANVQYTLATDTEWENPIATITDATNPYSLTALTANTQYKVRVQSVCGGSDVSAWKEGTFKTACGIITDFPWTEGFESMSTEDWGCWSTEQVSGTDNWKINSSGDAQEGSKFAQKSWTTATANLYTPVFDLSELSNPTISYYYKARPDGSSIDYLRVYYRTSNTAEWQLLVEHSGTVDVWQYEERLLPDPSATYQIKFEGEAHGGYGLSLDNLQIRNVACTLPSDVAISGITSATAQVSWNGEATVVEYKPTSANEWTSVNVTTSPVTLENLTANTMYDLRVGRLCGEMQYPTNGSTFKTQCAAISVATEAWTTSFEEDETGSGTVPACWTRPGTSSYPYVYTSSYTNYARTGSKTLYWSYNTNPIALPVFAENVQDLQLSLFARTSYGDYNLEIGFMTDPTDTSTFEMFKAIDITTSYPTEPTVMRFKAYQGTAQYIAIRPSYGSVYVDDITVELAPTCFEPENVVASNITTSSATITWEDESESTAWTLEYKKANETEYTAIEGLTEKTYNLPSLDVNTMYNVRLTGNCVGGETVSDVVTFSTSALNVTAIPFTENFEESNSYVQLSSTGTNQWFVGNATATVDGENSLYVSNDEGATNAYDNSATSNAYAYMTVEFGDAPEYFLSFDWKSRGESSNWDRLMVFLMNEDEDLSSLSRTYTTGRIFNQSTFTADPTWQNALITLNDVQNTTKKLVFYWYNDGTGGDNPPAAIDNITIDECVAPSDVVVSDITETTANLVWNDLGGSNTWTVEYKQTSEDTWTTVSGQTTKTYAFEDLRPNTSYDVRVAGNCNATKYSDVAQFTTLCLPTASEREATICDNETYTDADFTLTAENEGINEVVLQNQYGCDSTITLTLTVNPTYAPVFDVEICEGESYTENNFNVENPEPGVYQYTQELQTVNGCDSIVTLNLTVNPVYSQTINATICEGESYDFNNQTYTQTGQYVAELQSINGCDSTVTLNLSVTPLNNQTFNATICEGEIYNENGFMANQSGTYTREVVENGCTSIWTLNLTVNPLQTETINETVCYGETFTYNGQTYSQTGTYTTTVENDGACPTVVTINLTVTPLQTETINETICYGETFTYNGQTYSQTGTYTTVVEGEEGACDTEVTINLVIRDANPDIDELVVLDNSELPYTFMGNEYNDYGTYVVTVQDENGCEQVYNLTIQHNSGLNAVESIYNVTLYPNPTMDNATLKVEGLNEEATVVVTDQTGRMISSEKLALGQTEMTINSASLAEGVYYIRIITKNSTRTEKLIRR